MTKDQFEKYQKIEQEIAPVRAFLFWCGDRYKEPTVGEKPFSIKTTFKRFCLRRQFHGCTESDNLFEIPHDLQCRLVKVMEEYLDEREKEKEAL